MCFLMAVLRAGNSFLSANGKVIIRTSGVRIGQHIYPITRIGNLLWTTKNCFERLQDVEVIYPNGNSLNEEKDGLLYKAYDMFNKVIPILPTGWRVPTLNDFYTLVDGDDYRRWNDYLGEDLGGQNKDELNIRLNGWRAQTGAFSSYGNQVGLWTSTPHSSTNTTTVEYGRGTRILDSMSWGNGSPTNQYRTAEAIRFVRDV